MRIPDCQAELMKIAEKAPPKVALRLRWIVIELYRRPSRRTEPKSVSMTPIKAKAIQIEKARRPNLSHQEIANRHRVNPGRVSESLIGKRV
jgi:hypothetical protein